MPNNTRLNFGIQGSHESRFVDFTRFVDFRRAGFATNEDDEAGAYRAYVTAEDDERGVKDAA